MKVLTTILLLALLGGNLYFFHEYLRVERSLGECAKTLGNATNQNLNMKEILRRYRGSI